MRRSMCVVLVACVVGTSLAAPVDAGGLGGLVGVLRNGVLGKGGLPLSLGRRRVGGVGEAVSGGGMRDGDVADGVGGTVERVAGGAAEETPEDIAEDTAEDMPKDIPKHLSKDISKDIPKNLPVEDLPLVGGAAAAATAAAAPLVGQERKDAAGSLDGLTHHKTPSVGKDLDLPAISNHLPRGGGAALPVPGPAARH
ncbi:uncharacterized protein MAM_07507 [Metarhizium album ARSEF 1941]|uniref:Secreted protein n=1 Tax=Metarhizium album (strain ARSEF 1941) TaxID=1081103 RepID=A0A0B2WFA4_METAS|nr:uncharacterized protein MAM_07507 [Metarhizium album ARSEF 1941]KHN94601.1 hypothetical protein MAM_07507 [Metarhizium album ARSEF 1941]